MEAYWEYEWKDEEEHEEGRILDIILVKICVFWMKWAEIQEGGGRQTREF